MSQKYNYRYNRIYALFTDNIDFIYMFICIYFVYYSF